MKSLQKVREDKMIRRNKERGKKQVLKELQKRGRIKKEERKSTTSRKREKYK